MTEHSSLVLSLDSNNEAAEWIICRTQLYMYCHLSRDSTYVQLLLKKGQFE